MCVRIEPARRVQCERRNQSRVTSSCPYIWFQISEIWNCEIMPSGLCL